MTHSPTHQRSGTAPLTGVMLYAKTANGLGGTGREPQAVRNGHMGQRRTTDRHHPPDCTTATRITAHYLSPNPKREDSTEVRMLTFHDYHDALAAHTSWRRFISKHYEPVKTGWLYDRNWRYGLDAMVPSAIAFDRMIEDTVSADVCWMTHEMMDLCQHAAETFDRTESFDYEDAFIPHGFMVLPEPWMSRDINGKLMAQRVFLWRVEPYGCKWVGDADAEGAKRYTYDVDSPMDGVIEPVLRITVLSHVMDEDDYTQEHAEEWADLRRKGYEWGIVHTTAIPMSMIGSTKDVRGEGDSEAGWLTFWRVFQKLMAERIIVSEMRQARRPIRREAIRHGFDPSLVQVIELRRPRQDRDGEPVENGGGREYTHRFVVRGHWRQQPYPSLGVTKQIWIASYVKGPEDLPLVIRERVWNWDR